MTAQTDTDSSDQSGAEKSKQRNHCTLEDIRDRIQSLTEEVRQLRKDRSRLMSREEAADRLGISTRTLDDMADAGEIQPVPIRGRVLYSPDTLEAFIQRQADKR